jgi:hypothetical protein
MKPGECYMDEYYEPETVVLKVTEIEPVLIEDIFHYKYRVVYSSDPDRMRKDDIVSRSIDDEDLIPVAMMTIDNKLMIIKL